MTRVHVVLKLNYVRLTCHVTVNKNKVMTRDSGSIFVGKVFC